MRKCFYYWQEYYNGEITTIEDDLEDHTDCRICYRHFTHHEERGIIQYKGCCYIYVLHHLPELIENFINENMREKHGKLLLG